MWGITWVDEFSAWFQGLTELEQDEILASLELLKSFGPNLGRPKVDSVKGSIHSNMKELRVQIAGKPWRILFAFDPARSAAILVGGDKSRSKRWYETQIPIADRRFQDHLDRLRNRG